MSLYNRAVPVSYTHLITMYHKVIVMEIKETYALVMAEDGQILRVVYKDGMKVGDCIYILEEDILKKDSFKEENHASIIPCLLYTSRCV